MQIRAMMDGEIDGQIGMQVGLIKGGDTGDSAPASVQELEN